MSAVSNGIIQMRQARLNASLVTAVESIRLRLLEHGADVALELKEIEEEMGEEAEDEIVMPRSAPASRTRYSQQSHLSGDSIEVRAHRFSQIKYSRPDL